MTLDELLAGDVPLTLGTTLRVHELGDLELPTGELVARDPLSGGRAPPFLVELAPGRYPVSLRIIELDAPPPTARYFDIAALVVRFRDGGCARWDIALTADDPPKEDLGAADYPGFMVDAARAAFLDASVQPALDDDHVMAQLRDVDAPPGGALVTLAAGTLAMCTSGAGDGVYPAFVGFDVEGRPVAMLIEFRMVPLARPVLLTDAQLDARTPIVAAELASDERSTLRGAISEAVALGHRARTLVPLLERIVTGHGDREDPMAVMVRERAARALADLDGTLGLRDGHVAVLQAGGPADRLELALAIVPALAWSDARSVELGAAAARIATSSAPPQVVIAAVRCLARFAVREVAVWTALAAHPVARVRIALLEACASSYGAAPDEDAHTPPTPRRGLEALDAAVAIGMRDGDPTVRAAAAHACCVAVAASPARRAALLPAIDDGDPRVVLTAARHLTFRADLDGELVTRLRAALHRIVAAGQAPHAASAAGALRRLDRP